MKIPEQGRRRLTPIDYLEKALDYAKTAIEHREKYKADAQAARENYGAPGTIYQNCTNPDSAEHVYINSTEGKWRISHNQWYMKQSMMMAVIDIAKSLRAMYHQQRVQNQLTGENQAILQDILGELRKANDR